MTAVTIPTPAEARDLRTLFADHPIVAMALAWLHANEALHLYQVVDVLPMWPHVDQLSSRELAAVYAAYIPEPAEACGRCGAAIYYETRQSDPGWWRHVDTNAMLAGDTPHPAAPAYYDDVPRSAWEGLMVRPGDRGGAA